MKKRIMFLESRFGSFYGAQKSMLKFIQSLDEKDFEFNVVTTKDGKLKKSLEENNIKVDVIKLGNKANVFGGKVLDYNFIEKLTALLQILFYNFKVVSYIYRKKIDIVYVNDLRALLYSVLATKIMRKKNVWYIRADVTDSKLTDIGLRHSDEIITIAHGVLRNLPQNKIEKYSSKITNIYTGFEFGQYQILNKCNSKKELDISEDRIVIGYLGSINERKGLDILIDAFISLNRVRNDLQLLLVGDVSPGHEDYWNDQVNKISKANLPYKHLPFCKEVSLAYSAMDIFVLPSRSEGLPRVVIEAMAHMLPVIATDVGGVKEIIPDSSLGLVIKKDDHSSLVRGLEYLIESQNIRRSMGNSANKHVKNKFNDKEFELNVNSLIRSI